MSMQILHDPTNGPLVGVITWRSEQPTTIDFRSQPDSERCGRCGRPDSGHVWKLIDPQPVEQDLVLQRGVVACGEIR